MSSKLDTQKKYRFDGKEAIGERLLEYRKRCKLTRDEVVELSYSGFARSSLQLWESGDREPKLEYIYDLANIYGVHPWQLLSGEEASDKSPAIHVGEECLWLPRYDVESSAGCGLFSGGVVEPVEQLPFPLNWARDRGLAPSNLAVISNKGDSMSPTIGTDAEIVVDLSENQAQDGSIYVVRVGDMLYTKRTLWVPSVGLRLISDNKAYDAVDIPHSDLKDDTAEVCAQVVSTIRDL